MKDVASSNGFVSGLTVAVMVLCLIGCCVGFLATFAMAAWKVFKWVWT